MIKHGYAEHLRSGRVLKRGPAFSKSAPALSTSSEDAKAHPPPWHSYLPRSHLKPAEKWTDPDFSRTSGSSSEKEKRIVHFADSPPKTVLETKSSGSSATPTEFIKTPSHAKALTAGKKMNLVDNGSGRRPSAQAPDEAKRSTGKDGGKEEDGKATQPKRHVEESELDNGMRGLRGMSQLHRAACADRFSFCCDASVGQPMMLGKATLNKANPGSWMSDAAYLQKFHNSAIRVVDPSGLQVKKEEPKKKKKKKNEDDIDELKMSDSGLFVPKYPIDDSLKTLRRLRKKWFPASIEEKTIIKVKHTEEQLTAANELKSEFTGLSMLGKIRSGGIGDDERREMEAAVLKSGY
jgi:hypothetical protein